MKNIQALAAAVMLTLGASAHAAPVEVDFSSSTSMRHLGSFTGTAAYDSTTDKLTIDITNTSKGVLTGVALEVEKGDAAKFERIAKTHWRDDRNHKSVVNTGKPFGAYEAGAAVNGQFGSTALKAGLQSGKTATFVFDVTGSNASSLTTADFFTGAHPQIVASFTGFKHTHFKNDKAGGFGTVVVKPSGTTAAVTPDPTGPFGPPPADIQTPPIHGGPITIPVNAPTGSAVPLPAAAPSGIIMLGLMGVFGIDRKLRKFAV